MQRRMRDQRGLVFITVALWLTAFLGLSVVAIDIGRVAFTANEVHAVADIAATAGAIALTKNGNPAADAQAVVAQNSVDGQQASIAASDVVVGNYNPTTGTFTAGGAPANAVRAHASATVNNVMAAVLGQATSTVARNAIAAFQPLGRATPGLPVALGKCFQCNPTDCPTTTLRIDFNTGNNNAGFITLGSSNAANGINDYVPSGCGGGGTTVPTMSAGQTISLDNGQKNGPVCRSFPCLLNQEFLVPVVGVSCGSAFSGQTAITGFATVRITAVHCDPTGSGSTRDNDKYIDLQPVFVDCRTDPNPALCQGSAYGGSCQDCGTGSVALVQ